MRQFTQYERELDVAAQNFQVGFGLSSLSVFSYTSVAPFAVWRSHGCSYHERDALRFFINTYSGARGSEHWEIAAFSPISGGGGGGGENGVWSRDETAGCGVFS